MKFQKIGISSEGGNVGAFVQHSLHANDKLEFVTSCTGEILKWSDPSEEDAINLVLKWEFAVKNSNGIKIYDKARKQHYRIYDKKQPPTNEEIIDAIKETYSDFEVYFEKEKVDKNLSLSPLSSSLIGDSLHQLKAMFADLPKT